MDFSSKIGLSTTAQKIVSQYYTDKQEYNQAKAAYFNCEQDFLAGLKKYDDYYQRALSLFVKIADDLHAEFISRNISDEVYYQTFSDLQIWNEACIIEEGVCGLKETEWLSSHLHLGIFKLGRLQFQPDVTSKKIVLPTCVLPRRTKVINIHIPKGTSITAELCDQSLNLAREFFKNRDLIFKCESWLLSPRLDNFLPPTSNIIKFKNRFIIYHTNYKSNPIERYLFGKVLQNKSDYIPASTFANDVKTAILRGDTIGEASGIIL